MHNNFEKITFPSNFLWGTATSAYQIEGAWNTDEKGPSIWDTFCQQSGKIRHGDHGQHACDHYNRLNEDLDLLAALNINTYRFSIAWSRIMPSGTGSVNPKGIDFYNRLIDGLLTRGIEPLITMYHWDLPQALHLRGGWLNPDSVKWFADYAHCLMTHFSDRVKKWIPLNEPNVVACLGYQWGIHAPGYSLSPQEYFQVHKNMLMAHGRAVQVSRQTAKQQIQIGFAPASNAPVPASGAASDIEAAREFTFSVRDDLILPMAWWTEPVFKKRLPQGCEAFHTVLPEWDSEALECVSAPIDFIGLNTYWGDPVRYNEDGVPAKIEPESGFERTAFDWPMNPSCLYWMPKFVWERYEHPIYITENGMSNIDYRSDSGDVADPQRIIYIQKHLCALHQAMAEGAQVEGYYYWSFLDNFEWAEGYFQRFGLVHVDFKTQERTVKDSGKWFSQWLEGQK